MLDRRAGHGRRHFSAPCVLIACFLSGCVVEPVGEPLDEAAPAGATSGTAGALGLTELKVSTGVLEPALNDVAVSYLVEVPFALRFIALTPVATEGAHVLVNGNAVASGTSWTVGPLAAVETPIAIVVGDADGDRRAYTLRVRRADFGEARIEATREGALFGSAVAISADGSTLAIGARGEAAVARAGSGDADASEDGAVYVFVRIGDAWTEQARFLARHVGANDQFGASVALSADGDLLVAGAPGESEDPTPSTESGAGAAYVFTRERAVWAQEARLEAPERHSGAAFGGNVALSADGAILAIGAAREPYAGVPYAGTVHVFARAPGDWTHTARVAAPVPRAYTWFGASVTLSADGRTLAVGAWGDSSDAMGRLGVGTELSFAGAVHVFERAGESWLDQATLKAANAGEDDQFGHSVALSSDGQTLAVGAQGEASRSSDARDDGAPFAGAAYVFHRAGLIWEQVAYAKASEPSTQDFFGYSVALSGDGATLAVGASMQAVGSHGTEDDRGIEVMPEAGVVHLFTRDAVAWSRQAVLEAGDASTGSLFGSSVAVAAATGALAVGAQDAGAVYVYGL